MKNISAALLTFLETTEGFNRADLFYIVLQNGQIITATTGQIPILFSYGNIFSGSPPVAVPLWYQPTQYGAWERGTVKSSANFTPKAEIMDLTVIADQNIIFPVGVTSPQLSMPLTAVVASGLFEGAQVTVLTVFWGFGETPAIGVARGYLITFMGQIANFEQAGRSKIKFKVVDLQYLLNYSTPPNIIQSGCRHTLFDHGCTLSQASFAFNNSAASGSNSSYLNLAGNINTAPHYNSFTTFSQGKLQFTSGYNNGLWYYIKSQITNTQIQLGRPLLFPIT